VQVARQERSNHPTLHRSPHCTAAHANQPSHRWTWNKDTDLPSPCRHKRTHDRADGAEGNFNSGEEEEQYSGEDQLDSLEEASPTSDTGYVAGSLDSTINGQVATPTSASSLGQTQTFNSLQTLSMPMTISQPQPINAGGGLV
jgi:hypothetical protein